MGKSFLPEGLMPVVLQQPATTNGGISSDYLCLKNINRCYLLVSLTQAVGHATGIDVMQATAVAGTGAKVMGKVMPIWANEDVAASDALTQQTAAVTYNVAATVKNKLVVFQVDPALLDTDNDFDCINVLVDDSSQATNFCSIVALCEMKYQGSVPTVITD